MADQGFEHLEFYQDSLKLVKAAYRLANELPDYERYNLADQLRRAACSVALNIAEGYGRYHYLDRLRFLYIARGSLAETLSAFLIARNLDYCTDKQLRWVEEIQERIEKILMDTAGLFALSNRVMRNMAPNTLEKNEISMRPLNSQSPIPNR